MSKATNVNIKRNVNDFGRLEKRLAQVLQEVEAPGLSAEEKAEAEKRFRSTLGHYTGPDTGLMWDDHTGKVSIAPGFHADADGNVVKD